MKVPEWLPAYGDMSYRGECALEGAEQITFVSRVRRSYPDGIGKLIVHIPNEGKRTFGQITRAKANGLTKGASDIIIPGNPSFLCELKRRDHTKSKWGDGQIEYLEAAKENGAFVCVAFGCDAAWEALQVWIAHTSMMSNG